MVVQVGDELTISYIDLDVPRSARRASLRRLFHFDCDCERCAAWFDHPMSSMSFHSFVVLSMPLTLDVCSHRCQTETAAGSSGKISYAEQQGGHIKHGAPKRRGRKARVSR